MRLSRRQAAALDLVGPAEIAGRLEVRSNTVSTWVARGLLPAPLVQVSRVPLWQWATVAEWAARTGRGPEVRRGTFSAEDLRLASRMLREARRQTAREVREAADAVAHFRDVALACPPPRPSVRAGGRFASNDGRANGIAEWDWFWCLSPARRELAARYMVEGGEAPDQYALAVARHLGSDDVEPAMSAWLYSCELEQAARACEAGRAPSPDVETGATYDPCELFSQEGAQYLAAIYAVEREAMSTVGEPAPVVEVVEWEEAL